MPKILIVDDDRTTARLLVTLFELEGFAVVANPRPDAVRATAREQHPDALLVDCHLADRDGLDVLREMRADPEFRTLPIVMTSGLDRSAECMRNGANAFVLKPFPPSELIETVRRVLEGVRNEE